MASSSDATPLSELLSALASGVRSASSLPKGDDFDFLQALPEVSSAVEGAQTELLAVLNEILQQVKSTQDKTSHDDEDDDKNSPNYADLEDPLLWEECVDACEYLLEHAEGALNSTTRDQLQSVARHGQSQLTQLTQNSVDMAKPQESWLQWTPPNERTKVFVPSIATKPHAKEPLDLSLREGHGLATRFGSLRNTIVSPDVIAPSHHVGHVYEHEIQTLQYADWMLTSKLTEPASISALESLTAAWIDTPEALQQLVQDIQTANVQVLALDLEAHSYRSFAGLTCLMQLSYKDSNERIHNYLIDTLALRFVLNTHLQPILANPNIVKVLHGADSDIVWLQRDFGLYVVNLFDTGRAAKTLGLPKHSYAYLLKHYVEITADKSFQLADWRVRPLTPEMQHYATQDTHYLLDIYERMKYDLVQQDPTLIQHLLQVSKQVSLFRYAGEPFDPDGYKTVWNQQQSRRRRQTAASASPLKMQERILKVLWDWRDRVARELDESLFFVCGKQHLVRLAMAHSIPTSVRAMQALFTNMSPVLLERATEVLQVIKEAAASETVLEATIDTGVEADEDMEDDGDDAVDEDEDGEDEEIAHPPVGAPSSAFIKPNYRSVSRSESISTPVLGTEALYREAGWTTPDVTESNEVVVDIVTTTDDDGESGANMEHGKQSQLLEVPLGNRNFATGKHTAHSLATARSRRFNAGLATVVAAQSDESATVSDPADQAQRAKQLSTRINADLLQDGNLSAILGIHAPGIDIEDPETEEDINGRSDGADTDDEEFPIPRSMREIYKISNRNRRHKKSGSLSPEQRGSTPTSDKEREELAKADALLRERGLLDTVFFKKQRMEGAAEETDSQDEQEAEATRQEDLRIIKEVGWISQDSDKAVFGGKAAVGLLDPGTTNQDNPFFSGAALVGGPLAQEFSKPRANPKRTTPTNAAGRGKSTGRNRERPDKKDGKTFAYRKR